jgi:hypothetical protein
METQRTIKVLNPVGNVVTKNAPISARIPSINGKTVGILWNSKPNGDILLNAVLELLKSKYKLAGHVWKRKMKFDVADQSMINELAAGSDLVIVGQGD